jgi:hypothetical protein
MTCANYQQKIADPTTIKVMIPPKNAVDEEDDGGEGACSKQPHSGRGANVCKDFVTMCRV